MIKTIAIDDEPLALRIIQSFCSEIDFISLEQVFTRTDEALRYLQENSVDLLFLDIHMPVISGLDFYKLLPHKPMVVFTTAYSEYAVEAFNLNVLDYLLKPFYQDRFLQCASKAKEYQEFLDKPDVKKTHLFIRADYMLHKICIADILYIEALGDYIKIYIQNSKTIVARLSLRVMMEMLPEQEFIRVHRSYIIAQNRITSANNKTVFLNDKAIPIGVSYDKDFFSRYYKT